MEWSKSHLMEANLVQAVVALLMVLLISWQCGKALWYLVWRPYAVALWFRRQGIQGPPYKLIVGSLPEARRLLISGRKHALDAGCHEYSSLVQPFFQKWASDYGERMFIHIGCSAELTIRNPFFRENIPILVGTGPRDLFYRHGSHQAGARRQDILVSERLHESYARNHPGQRSRICKWR